MKNKLFALLLVCILLLAGCGKGSFTTRELAEVLPELVEKSVPLNEIYFGEGFLPDGNAESLPVRGYYYADSTAAGFASIAEIREATEEVFTPSYAAILYASAFDGMTDGDTVVAPRYIEGEQGILQQIGGKVYDLPAREYLWETLSIVKSDADRVTVAVDTVANGEIITVELIAVRTVTADGNVYRLDSPTY